MRISFALVVFVTFVILAISTYGADARETPSPRPTLATRLTTTQATKGKGRSGDVDDKSKPDDGDGSKSDDDGSNTDDDDDDDGSDDDGSRGDDRSVTTFAPEPTTAAVVPTTTAAVEPTTGNTTGNIEEY